MLHWMNNDEYAVNKTTDVLSVSRIRFSVVYVLHFIIQIISHRWSGEKKDFNMILKSFSSRTYFKKRETKKNDSQTRQKVYNHFNMPNIRLFFFC